MFWKKEMNNFFEQKAFLFSDKEGSRWEISLFHPNFNKIKIKPNIVNLKPIKESMQIIK